MKTEKELEQFLLSNIEKVSCSVRIRISCKNDKMSYEEIHLHLHLSPKRHHFAVVSRNNKHIEKYINLQDVERRLVMCI